MSKAPIKSSDVVQDIRNGMNDDELMEKYGLSSTQLTSIFKRLIEAQRITQAELNTRGLILDDQPVREVKISPVRIPVFIATSLLCSVLFGWPFLLKQQKMISGGIDMFYRKGPGFLAYSTGSPYVVDIWHLDCGDLLQYILTLVTLAALTVVPPIIVWVWTPAWEVIRKSVHRFVKYKRFTARNIIGVVIGILFLLGVLYFWPSIYWIWQVSRANAGDASAQCYLGRYYQYSPSVPQHYSKAVDWYRKAAEQGDAEGQSELGSLYADGNGVPVDFKMAAFWYQKAVDQGSGDWLAKDGLARIRGR